MGDHALRDPDPVAEFALAQAVFSKVGIEFHARRVPFVFLDRNIIAVTSGLQYAYYSLVDFNGGSEYPATMGNGTKKPLEPWQKQDAERLRALYKERLPKGMTQLAFAVESGLGKTQGIVAHYLNGVTPLNLSAVIKFARTLNCTVDEISPTLAAELNAAPDHRVWQLFSGLTPDDRQLVLSYMERLARGTQAPGVIRTIYDPPVPDISRPATARRKA
jgi:transcriptional regulator with XRE-family HTH domain